MICLKKKKSFKGSQRVSLKLFKGINASNEALRQGR